MSDRRSQGSRLGSPGAFNARALAQTKEVARLSRTERLSFVKCRPVKVEQLQGREADADDRRRA